MDNRRANRQGQEVGGNGWAGNDDSNMKDVEGIPDALVWNKESGKRASTGRKRKANDNDDDDSNGNEDNNARGQIKKRPMLNVGSVTGSLESGSLKNDEVQDEFEGTANHDKTAGIVPDGIE